MLHISSSADNPQVGWFEDGIPLRRLEPRHHLFAEGDDDDRLYEIVEGVVCLYKLTVDGRRQVLAFRFAGDLLGLAHDGEHHFSAEALTEVRVRSVSRERLRRLVAQRPDLSTRLLEKASRELDEAHNQVVTLGRRSALEKVASFLVALDERFPGRHGVHLPMARADIADFLGLTIETVSRSLTRLRHERIIALPRVDLAVILDRDRLEALSEGDNASAVGWRVA